MIAVGCGVAILLSVTACGTSLGSISTITSAAVTEAGNSVTPGAQESGGAQPATTAAPAQATLELTPVNFTFQGDGAIAASFSLSKPMHGNDPLAANYFSGGALPCEVDETRDAVVIGSLNLQNQNPEFSTKFRMAMTILNDSGAAEGPVSFGMVVSDGPECYELGGISGEGSAFNPAVRPTWKGPDWGPVKVAFVFKGVYGPSNPNTPRSLMPVAVSALLGAYGDGAYSVSVNAGQASKDGPGPSMAQIMFDQL